MKSCTKVIFGILLLFLFNSLGAQQETPKILMHYMGWYGDSAAQVKSDSLRHWKHGHANNPQIGYYSSLSASLLTYHMLLAWVSGIDGVVINVKDAYDKTCMKKLIGTLQWIRDIDSLHFDFEFAISYDDQGFDLCEPNDTAIAKLTFLRDTIFPGVSNYTTYRGQPIIFSFDYPDRYLTARSFRSAIDRVFGHDRPLLIWNTLGGRKDHSDYIDAYYPWVQPGAYWDKEEGLIWGKEYLEYYYKRVNEINPDKHFKFSCGGVWPGFDDRKNISWGADRLMARQEGAVYDSTWSFIHSYDEELPIAFVVIETWNDWNEGTEIEPSMEDGYKYLEQTIEHASLLKGTEYNTETTRFRAAEAIYQASLLIESHSRDHEVYSPVLDNAVLKFIQHDFRSSMILSGQIIAIAIPGL